MTSLTVGVVVCVVITILTGEQVSWHRQFRPKADALTLVLIVLRDDDHDALTVWLW